MGVEQKALGLMQADEEMTAAMRLGAGVRIVEALLFASREPVADEVLAEALPSGVQLKDVIATLEPHYAARGVTLRRIGRCWAFRTAPDLAHLLVKESEEPRKLSRAAVETLAIIAYHQPVTRAEIEDIRGVATAKGTLDVLLEAGFVRMRGRRKTPGRPITFGTTEGFLSISASRAWAICGPRRAQAGRHVRRTRTRRHGGAASDHDPALRGDEDPLEGDELLASAEERINEAEEPLDGELPEEGVDGGGSDALSEEDRLDPLEGERRR